MAELLAYGTLLNEGFPVRFSGQDVERGTFSHRHAVVRVEDSEEQYTPLNNIDKKQADFEIYNSLLSEYAVLGFEYGYAMTSPNSSLNLGSSVRGFYEWCTNYHRSVPEQCGG